MDTLHLRYVYEKRDIERRSEMEPEREEEREREGEEDRDIDICQTTVPYMEVVLVSWFSRKMIFYINFMLLYPGRLHVQISKK